MVGSLTGRRDAVFCGSKEKVQLSFLGVDLTWPVAYFQFEARVLC